MSDLSHLRSRPLILVTDDDRLVRILVCDTLEAEGYTVLQACNGEEALSGFERYRPSLLILDVKMPGMDGFRVCEEIRKRHAGLPVPILMITAAEDPNSVYRAYEAGATDFIPKPINCPLLGHRVRYLLRSSEVLQELGRSQHSLATAQRIAHLGSWEWDTVTNEMQWSEETYRIFCVQPGSIQPTYELFWSAVHPEERVAVREEVEAALNLSKRFSVEHRLLLPNGTLRYAHQQGEVVADELREGRWISGTIQDVTEQMRTQEKIRLLANYDSLTGLANRRFFKDQFARALAAARSRGHRVGLLFMDLDRFKHINDTLGHRAGDALLQHVADRLRDHVRGSDMVARGDDQPPAPEISRLGGDEFTVLLSKISRPEDAGDVARRILRTLPQPIRIDGTEVSARISIGIATFPLDGQDVDTLMRNADVAMYHAKERGRNTYQFFCDSMNIASLRKLALESRLREALERRELRLHYQPRFDFATREMVGCEALLRWQHPELGTVSPAEFIPVSEECGLIHPIGDWVLREACAQNKAWQDAGYPSVVVSVNVSTRQFIERDIRKIITDALTETGLAPGYLEMEITESALMHNDEATAIAFRDLRSMGVRIALDDFGTGYSSLSYLTRFPLDVLKMDRAFVRDVDSDPAAKGVTKAVIQMAHSLGLRVVAEGVDSESQAEILREQGCDELQGFLLSSALPPGELIRFFNGE